MKKKEVQICHSGEQLTEYPSLVLGFIGDHD